jgi:hypothetical protein
MGKHISTHRYVFWAVLYRETCHCLYSIPCYTEGALVFTECMSNMVIRCPKMAFIHIYEVISGSPSKESYAVTESQMAPYSLYSALLFPTPIYHIFNLSLLESVCPQAWREAKKIPLPKNSKAPFICLK